MKFTITNNVFMPVGEGTSVIDALPKGIYHINQNPNSLQFYLTKQEFDKFALPEKLYGNVEAKSNRVVKKYSLTSKNLGVLLAGEKGSGKSLTAKHIINSLDVPVLILKEYYSEGDFNGFISSFDFSFALYIDEFEKIVLPKDQHTFLPLLDGWNDGHMLTIMTVNSQADVNRYMQNRTSRIHYLWNFYGMSNKEIDEVINDKLQEPEKHKENLIRLVEGIGAVNFDTLISIITEINDIGSSDPNELYDALNVEAENYNAEVILQDKEGNYVKDNFWYSNLHKEFTVEGFWFTPDGKQKEGDNVEYFERSFKKEDATRVQNTASGQIIEIEDYTITISRKAAFKRVVF